jgi:L,D-transpeptidase catalytic domain
MVSRRLTLVARRRHAAVLATTMLSLVGAVSREAAAQSNGRSSLGGEATDSGALKAPAARTHAMVRIAVSLASRTLWVIAGSDTLRAASVAVASNQTLAYAGRQWRFAAPRGRRVVLSKRASPVWLPPDWHYAEVARDHRLRLRALPATGVRLSDGRWLVVRDSLVGTAASREGEFDALPVDEHIVFDSTLFIPPLATHNRRLLGALGPFALDLGNGFLLHGTPDPRTIGTATTHGCIRLLDADIAWLYENVPVGAIVHVF